MRGRLLALFAAAVLLAGCGTVTGSDSVGTDDPSPRTQADASTWEFSAPTLGGDTFDGTTLTGTPTVIWFWAPWCPTCRAQIPTVSRLAEEYDGQVEFVGAGGLASGDEIRSMAEEIPHVTHLVDVEGQVWQKFGVTSQSTFEIINADGEIVSSGYVDDQELEKLVAELAE